MSTRGPARMPEKNYNFPAGAGGDPIPKNMGTVRARGIVSPRWGGREKPRGEPDSEGAAMGEAGHDVNEPGAR